MNLSPDQENALAAVNAWLASRDKPWFYLTGPAGSGKTTLATEIASSWSGPVYAMAYTGKAALVLTKKGLPATTIHSKIYVPANERNEELAALQTELAACTDQAKSRRLLKRIEELNSPSFVLRPNSPFQSNGLIILDEVSMVSSKEAEDLLSFDLPVLVLGDDNQLPPIEGRGYFNKPDFALTQIHRQAADNPIIRLATMIREGRKLDLGPFGESLITTRKKITKDLALSCSQIICGSNKARVELNNDMREFQGFSGDLPQKSERLICLRNNPKDGLLNGRVVDLAADAVDTGAMVTLKTTEGLEVLAHKACFTNPEFLKSWSYKSRARANEFDWAWAITGHKSQGSQWESVLVWADMFKWDADMYRRWLYTSVTRAEKRVVVAL